MKTDCVALQKQTRRLESRGFELLIFTSQKRRRAFRHFTVATTTYCEQQKFMSKLGSLDFRGGGFRDYTNVNIVVKQQDVATLSSSLGWLSHFSDVLEAGGDPMPVKDSGKRKAKHLIMQKRQMLR